MARSGYMGEAVSGDRAADEGERVKESRWAEEGPGEEAKSAESAGECLGTMPIGRLLAGGGGNDAGAGAVVAASASASVSVSTSAFAFAFDAVSAG